MNQTMTLPIRWGTLDTNAQALGKAATAGWLDQRFLAVLSDLMTSARAGPEPSPLPDGRPTSHARLVARDAGAPSGLEENGRMATALDLEREMHASREKPAQAPHEAQRVKGNSPSVSLAEENLSSGLDGANAAPFTVSFIGSGGRRDKGTTPIGDVPPLRSGSSGGSVPMQDRACEVAIGTPGRAEFRLDTMAMELVNTGSRGVALESGDEGASVQIDLRKVPQVGEYGRASRALRPDGHSPSPRESGGGTAELGETSDLHVLEAGKLDVELTRAAAWIRIRGNHQIDVTFADPTLRHLRANLEIHDGRVTGGEFIASTEAAAAVAEAAIAHLVQAAAKAEADRRQAADAVFRLTRQGTRASRRFGSHQPDDTTMQNQS